MPFPVLLNGAGARIERFCKRKIGCPVKSGMSGKHDCDTRKEFRVTELSPESGIRREMSAEPDKGLFRIPVRGHRLEFGCPKFQSGRGRKQQLDERVLAPQPKKHSIGL